MDFCKLTGLSNAFFVIVCLIRMLQCHIQVPAKLQKNLHQGKALMQIFLNLIESFSIFYPFVTFLSGHQPMLIIQPVRVFCILGRLVEFLLPNVREELKDKMLLTRTNDIDSSKS